MAQRTALTGTRTLVSTILILVGAVAVSASVTAHWMGTVLLDNDTFVAATSPLLVDNATLQVTSDRVSDALLKQLDLKALTEANVPDSLRSLVGGLAADFEQFARDQVSAAVHSAGFATLATSRLRAWHLAFARTITTRSASAPTEGTALRVTLGPYIDLLAQKTDQPLVRYVLERLPDGVRDAQVAVLDAQPFADRLPALRALSRARPCLPWAAALALALGLFVAPRKRLAMVGSGVALVASAIALKALVASEAGRAARLVSGSMGASPAASTQAIDSLTAPLLAWNQWVIGAGAALVALGVILLLLQRRKPAQPDLPDEG
ncbi:MAG: hypothetical protein CVT67_04840 [Actinobacteria bacterium HGW-Actinobacteria-7]|jgi:hypothetical protein|nr:MAG: hypothetical protein CVT67_04840 [Actinobacteria bacterium HGW-Actinobacteria-7]